MRVINAENLIVGRMATKVAKLALLGESIAVVNCEKAVMTGRKKQIIERQKQKRNFGTPFKGTFISRMPDRFVRRIIRGMLPYKKGKGKMAFKRVMCYLGVPEEFSNNELETIKEADVSKLKNLNYLKIKDICNALGGKEY